MSVGPYEDPHRYLLHHRVSSGAEGAVWRASVSVDGNPLPVAVKIIADAHLGDLGRWRERWNRQSELLRSLDHPSVIRVREVFEGPSPGANAATRSLYLVMNWASGMTLAEWIASKRRPLHERLAMIDAVGAAVTYLHSGADTNGQPVLHRDIKPSNVIVDGTLPRLVDFGFVRFGGHDSTMVGTAGYIAPEVAAGVECTTASDLYSFGALAFTVLTGHKPTLSDLQNPARVLEADPELAARPDVARAIGALLSPDPAARPLRLSSLAASAAEPVPPPWSEPESPESFASTTVIRPRPASAPDAVQAAAITEELVQPRRRWSVVATVVVVMAIVGGAVGGTIALLGGRDTSNGRQAPASAALATSTTPTNSTTTTVPLVAIPPVVRLTADEARSQLTAIRMDVQQQDLDDRTEAIGTVITQSVAAGTPAAPGSVVVLQVAGRYSHVPKVDGATLRLAQQQLTNKGFLRAPTEAPYPPYDANAIVADQSIDAGERVDRMSQITLVMVQGSPGG